ncbi:wax ester/triacylglycerol synthase family O-acyltransferase [Nakamurella leprariae]|uniref:Diacylglycerol O-acyltransferase n=1 Tax=Nakamurella leprariae TaxID=2803911 RepID=A0A938YHG6_9ACTN|nr:wax ester/triacylglycerol synthase family O-acyltransferase [Nakamurella leprariae]MBM9468209.1 wax ester/triacylglycerol synthase family O-acyltransferase [Nakamurella leprariae]
MTDRLSVLDTASLFSADAGSPTLVGGMVVLEPPAAGFDYAAMVDLIGSRLALVPRFRQRVQTVPGRLARPVWVDDAGFDLSYHVRRSALPPPGSRAQLDDLIGRLISRPLDPHRPLWEIYVVEGLSGGRVALVNKTHPVLVDQLGAVDLAAAILDTARTPRPVADQPWIPTPPPSAVDLVVDAVVDLAAQPTAAVDMARFAAADARAAAARLAGVAADAVRLASRVVTPVPRSVLTRTRSGQRRFATVRTDLDDFKAIRRAHGVSVNDVVLAVVTGAVRTYLLSRNEPVVPSTVLRATVPVSVRESTARPGVAATPSGRVGVSGPTGTAATGATVRSALVDLPVAEPNAVIRLHQVAWAMGAQLSGGQRVGADTLVELGRFAPPTLHALGARVARELSRRLSNVLITNVPGPQVPLYAGGLPVTAMFPVAPLVNGQTLAVSCTSYHGGVYFGLTADRDAIPDLADIGEALTESLVELLVAGQDANDGPESGTAAAQPAPVAPSDPQETR